MQKIFAFDFDLTFVDSLSPWLYWITNSGVGEFVTLDSIEGKGDLIPYFESLGVEHPWEYWLLPNLYDDMEPMEGAVEVLRSLKDAGYTVICVSKCVPEHYKSKKALLDKYVPFIDGFIDTGDKQFVDFTVIVDDSDDMVKKCSEYGKKVIQPNTPPSNMVEGDNIWNDHSEYGQFWTNPLTLSSIIQIMESDD